MSRELSALAAGEPPAIYFRLVLEPLVFARNRAPVRRTPARISKLLIRMMSDDHAVSASETVLGTALGRYLCRSMVMPLSVRTLIL
jgi:hypothetical protein